MRERVQDMKLLRSIGNTTFCVPAAVALITGEHLDTIENELREFLGDEPISCIYYPIALALLRKHNFVYQTVRRLTRSGTFLCFTKNHAFVYHDGVYFDNSCPNGWHTHDMPRTKLMFKVEKAQ
jgi:hypothetical protein